MRAFDETKGFMIWVYTSDKLDNWGGHVDYVSYNMSNWNSLDKALAHIESELGYHPTKYGFKACNGHRSTRGYFVATSKVKHDC